MLTRKNSAFINECRMVEMRERQELVESLRRMVHEKLAQALQGDAYKQLLRKLVVQGLIKLMEKNVRVKCLEKDQGLLRGLKEACQKQFSEMIRQQTGKEMQSSMQVNENHILEAEGDFRLGGVMVTCHEGRIVCNNTLESRIEMVFGDFLPQIRGGLFPRRK